MCMSRPTIPLLMLGCYVYVQAYHPLMIIIIFIIFLLLLMRRLYDNPMKQDIVDLQLKI